MESQRSNIQMPKLDSDDSLAEPIKLSVQPQKIYWIADVGSQRHSTHKNKHYVTVFERQVQVVPVAVVTGQYWSELAVVEQQMEPRIIKYCEKLPRMNGKDIDCQPTFEKLVESILDEDDTTADSNSDVEYPPAGFQIKYKTEKCRYWTLGLECPFKDNCTFAHGNGQLRDKQHVSKKYKTKVCLNFERTGCCKYGDRCQFMHPVEKPRVCNKQTHNNLSFCDILAMLPGEMSVELGIPTRRLKVFEKFETDSFEGVDWRWKKNRLYSI